jgi:hypothetical protein
MRLPLIAAVMLLLQQAAQHPSAKGRTWRAVRTTASWPSISSFTIASALGMPGVSSR